MKTLWFSKIPAKFDAERDIPFGVNSIVNVESYLKAGSCNCLAPVDSIAEMALAERLVSKLYWNVYLDYVVKNINVDSDVMKSDHFWSIIVSPWLMFLLQICYLNYSLLEKYKARYGDDRMEVVIPVNAPFFFPPRSSPELVNWLKKHDVHAWIASRYLKADTPAKWNVKVYEPEIIKPLNKGSTRRLNIRHYIRFLSLNMMRCINEQIPLGTRILLSIILSAKKVTSIEGLVDDRVFINCNHAHEVPGFFIRTTEYIINELIPTFYRKGFSEAYKKINKKKFRPGHGRIFTSNLFYCDYANMFKAIAYEKGEAVFTVQHGGGYGIHKVFPLSQESEYLGGLFITWGWQEHESYRVKAVPLPSPSLSRLLSIRQNTNMGNDIVFVGADMSPYMLRIHSKPTGGQWLDYREQKLAFLCELSEEIFRNVLYRGFYTGTFQDEKYLIHSFSNLRLLRGNYHVFHRCLMSARLCVVDHPITTLHQVLAMNIPTVAFWNDDHWGVSCQATPFFAELESVGILHKTGEQAGKFVNENFHNVKDWWETEEVQLARRRWCDVYARTSRHWLIDWMKALFLGN